ncbi:MAG: NnrS family protein [Campylobacteraceae bacterium]|jgi:uncharacterized protein involved in response to NO|nr:NnrS family protein [Campylobacteraceae bacterium]
MSNAAKHYLCYPKDENVKPYLGFAFRPFFLILPWYVVCITLFWGLNFGGIIIFLPFLHPAIWHIHEILFASGYAALGAFLLTALPELFPGQIPIIGKKLKYIVLLWILGRFSFWFMDIFGVFIAMITNVAFALLILVICFKPIVLDPLQRHSSIAYLTIAIVMIQIMFFISTSGYFEIEPIKWLYMGLSFFIALIILALRRIQTEEINGFMEELGMEEKFIAKSFRYNLSIFCILLFGIVEFFVQNSILGWLCFACAASILGIMNDYRLKYESILSHPFVLFFATVFIMIAIGFAILGLSYLEVINEFSYARHVLSIGGFGGAILVAMFIISFVHTGRKPKCDKWILLAFFLLVFAVALRYFTAQLGSLAYLLSSFCFAACFAVYFFRFKNYLLNKRADGLLG